MSDAAEPTAERPGAPPSDPWAAYQEGLRHEVAVTRLLHPYARQVTPALHLGEPGGPRVRLQLPPAPTHVRQARPDPYGDPVLRRDVLARLWERAEEEGLTADGRPLLAWHVRGGTVEVVGSDLGWSGAARLAALDRGLTSSGLCVVTPQGWVDPESGRSRSWQRLRVRGRDGSDHVRRLARELAAADGVDGVGGPQAQVWTGSLACIRSA